MGRTNISRKKRLSVYIRDKWTCQYCGLKFDPAETWNSDSASPCIYLGDLRYVFLELDHIHPRKHGGTDALDNLRAACSPCNRAKSASLERVDWAERCRIARQILMYGPMDRERAELAAVALLGLRSRSELQHPRFLLEVVDGA